MSEFDYIHSAMLCELSASKPDEVKFIYKTEEVKSLYQQGRKELIPATGNYEQTFRDDPIRLIRLLHTMTTHNFKLIEANSKIRILVEDLIDFKKENSPHLESFLRRAISHTLHHPDTAVQYWSLVKDLGFFAKLCDCKYSIRDIVLMNTNWYKQQIKQAIIEPITKHRKGFTCKELKKACSSLLKQAKSQQKKQKNTQPNDLLQEKQKKRLRHQLLRQQQLQQQYLRQLQPLQQQPRPTEQDKQIELSRLQHSTRVMLEDALSNIKKCHSSCALFDVLSQGHNSQEKILSDLHKILSQLLEPEKDSTSDTEQLQITVTTLQMRGEFIKLANKLMACQLTTDKPYLKDYRTSLREIRKYASNSLMKQPPPSGFYPDP